MKLGRFSIGWFVAESFRLDGGTMFGVVPKKLWDRLLPADGSNLIPMVNNIFVLQANGKTIIFDAGLGDTLSDREKKIYGTSGDTALESGLASLGFTPADIDIVILSHLHTDHCAGAVKRDGNRYVPRFPKARYIVAKPEWDCALAPDERTSAVYIPERLYPLLEAKQLELVTPDCEFMPGVKLVFTGGHSIGHFGIELSSEGRTAAYYADMFPSIHHMKVAFVPATDVLPLETMAFKRGILPRIVDEQITLLFDHDHTVPCGQLSVVDGQYKVSAYDAD